MKPPSWSPASGQKPWVGRVSRAVERPKSPLLVVSVLMFIVFLLYINTLWHFWHSASSIFMAETRPIFEHPISKLIASARNELAALDTNHDLTVNEAAQLYRQKRGRHPPPSFDKWVAFAASRGRSVNEAFFDQIYEDLEPFWGKQPEALRTFAKTFSNSISIRNGEVKFVIDPVMAPGYFHGKWIQKWIEAIQEISADLPDMDLAMNEYDEARIIVPWEEMALYMETATKSRHVRAPTNDAPLLDEYTKYPGITEDPTWKMGDEWDSSSHKWRRTRVACRPDSPVRNKEVNETGYPHFVDVRDQYVHNLTHARHVCEQPDLYNFHSAFIRPMAPPTTTQLYPLFGACKIFGISNDIVLPAAMYMLQNSDSNGGATFAGGTDEQKHVPWSEKIPKAFWRGSDSGGMADEVTWRYFQRPRMASMMNGTQVRAQEPYMHHAHAGYSTATRPSDEEAARVGASFDFPWPHRSLAALGSKVSTFGRWVSSLCDAGITNTNVCQWGSHCEWLWPYFETAQEVPMADNFKHKYLPDVDGFSYSGRYNAFLDSTSLPIKATIYAEWHHSRLVPWQHFVPMDNTMRDWWGILEYFAGFDAEAFGAETSLHREPHDEEAEMIALQGSEWSKQHLRRDDMIVYIYRLLLEYARICDDRRENMGWTGDLVM